MQFGIVIIGCNIAERLDRYKYNSKLYFTFTKQINAEQVYAEALKLALVNRSRFSKLWFFKRFDIILKDIGLQKESLSYLGCEDVSILCNYGNWSNPLGLCNSWKVGGLFADIFPLKTGKHTSSAKKKEIDWKAFLKSHRDITTEVQYIILEDGSMIETLECESNSDFYTEVIAPLEEDAIITIVSAHG